MRSLTRILAAGALCLGVAGQNLALAQSSSLSSLFEVVVNFHRASTEALPGYTLMVSPEGQYYVGPDVLFTGDDVISIQLLHDPGAAQLDPSTATLELILTEAAYATIVTSAHNQQRADRLAFLVDGALIAAPMVQVPTVTTYPLVLLKDISLPIARRLVNLLSGTGAGTDVAMITVAPVRSKVKPGDVLTADLYITNVTGLSGYQVQAVATGARTGPLPLEDIWIDTGRPDYVFGARQAISAADLTRARIVSALFGGDVDVGETRKYLGTCSFRTPENVSDTFYVNIVVGRHSLLCDSSITRIPFEISGAMVTSVRRAPLRGARSLRTE